MFQFSVTIRVSISTNWPVCKLSSPQVNWLQTGISMNLELSVVPPNQLLHVSTSLRSVDLPRVTLRTTTRAQDEIHTHTGTHLSECRRHRRQCGNRESSWGRRESHGELCWHAAPLSVSQWRDELAWICTVCRRNQTEHSWCSTWTNTINDV